MKKLTELLNHYIVLMQNTHDLTTRENFYRQCFGAVQYHGFLFPEQESELEELWDGYKKRLENLVYNLD